MPGEEGLSSRGRLPSTEGPGGGGVVPPVVVVIGAVPFVCDTVGEAVATGDLVGGEGRETPFNAASSA